MLRPPIPGPSDEGFTDGRLRARPRVSDGRPPWSSGLRPLPGALLMVPERPPTRLLVWFHGARQRPTDALPLLGPVVARHGPLVLVPEARRSTWDLVQGRFGPDVAALDGLLHEVLSRYDVRVAFGGFSDGASYALSLGLTNGDLVERVLAFSPGWCRPAVPVGRPRIRVAHGARDEVLPAELTGRQVATTLAAKGYAVDYVDFDGGHAVTPQILADALPFWLG